jgi:DNA-directed RNA polymerase specialized sigma24 family protein
MVTPTAIGPSSWPHNRPRSSMRAGGAVRKQNLDANETLDADETLDDTDARVELAEAVLAAGAPRPERSAADRLLADQLVVKAIIEEGLNGPRHRELEEVLIRYAVPALRNLLAGGAIVGKAARLGRPLGGAAAWLDFTETDREEFARDMVADALPVFTKAVFEEQRWSPAGGASLKTYFVNGCTLQFPALYRKWKAQRRMVLPVGLQIGLSGDDPVLDPADVAVRRDEAARMLEMIPDPQIREYVALRADDHTAEEAARQVGLTLKAAEGRLARIRKKLRAERGSTKPPGSEQRDADARQGGR